MATEYTTLEGRVIRTTDRAVLVETPDGDEVWIPRSVCYSGDALEDGDEDPQVADWWIEKEGVE